MFVFFYFSCVHNVCIEGPLSQTPITVPGVVVKARTEFLDIVTKYDQTSIKTVVCYFSNGIVV